MSSSCIFLIVGLFRVPFCRLYFRSDCKHFKLNGDETVSLEFHMKPILFVYLSCEAGLNSWIKSHAVCLYVYNPHIVFISDFIDSKRRVLLSSGKESLDINILY